MSKPELINQLKEKNPKLNKFEIEIIIDTFLKGIISAIKEGRTVELRHFGKLYLKKIKEKKIFLFVNRYFFGNDLQID